MPHYIDKIQPTRPGMLSEGPTEQENQAVGEHFASLQRTAGQEQLFMAGRTLVTDDRSFGIAVFAPPH